LLAGITCFLPRIILTTSSMPSNKSGCQCLGQLCMQPCMRAESAALGFQPLGWPAD